MVCVHNIHSILIASQIDEEIDKKKELNGKAG